MPPFDVQEQRWFSEELHPHEEMLRGWLQTRFPSLNTLDDIIQEAYIRTVKRSRKKPLASPKAFLFAIARNLCIDAIRREKVINFESFTDLHERTLVEEGASVPERMIAREDYELLVKAIQSLPKKCRRIFTLRKVYGLTLTQIAGQLNISVKTVEAQISIGIRRTREHFNGLQDNTSR
jgi:RNA polymerase sigma factor (sigma-70 family)